VGGIYSSDAGNIMSIGQPFAATYYDSDKHRVFSLRSATDGLDVSEIAKEFGGGGHVHAAGFKVPRSHELAKV
jgi:oligoribonuclease NrnB/cAMP/cGMP phosphodiesterase (DHH superfamily)